MTSLFAVALAALTACGGCGPEPAAPDADPEEAPAIAPRDDLPNIVLVSLDTTRADRLGAYGYESASTPTFDALAAAGQRFDRAYSHAALTIPSHASLFTGQYAYRMGIRSNGDNVLQPQYETMAEILKSNGYATAASVAAFVTQRQWGFDQGFDAYFDEIAKTDAARQNQWMQIRSGDQVVDDALGWLEERPADQPYFLWVHMYDAHAPLSPPKAYVEAAEARGGDAYDAAITFMDDQIKRLQEAAGEDTLWVVLADHGEGMGGHLELNHGLFLYNGTQRVPMVISGPGIEPGVVEQNIGLVDVLPTLLGHLEIEAPGELDGEVQPGNPHPQFIESYELMLRYRYSPHVAIVDGDRKLINTPRPELYDQVGDVREITDLAESEPQEVERLQKMLADMEIPPPTDQGSEIDPETLARLQALGYVGAEFEDGLDFSMLPDPKDRKDIIRLIQQAHRARHMDDTETEIAKLREALALDPNIVETWLQLSRRLAETGDFPGALETLEKALEQHPDSENLLVATIALHGGMGKLDEALALAERGIEENPSSDVIYEMYAGTLLNVGRVDEGFEAALDFLETHPETHGLQALLGNFLASQDQWQQAAPFLSEAGQGHQPRYNVRRNLGALAAMSGRLEEAEGFFLAELEDYPRNEDARVLLARAYAQQKKYAEQLAQIELLLKSAPEAAKYHHGKSMALLNSGDADASLAAARAGLEHDAEHPGLLLMVANALSKQGKSEEALEAFEQAKAAKAKRDGEISAKVREVEEQVAAGAIQMPFWMRQAPEQGQ